MNTKKIRKILIADPDREFLSTMTSDPGALKIPPVVAASGKEAQLVLADPNQLFSGVFINPLLQNPHAVSVVRFSRRTRPATPVFFIYDEKIEYNEKELKELGIQKTIAKPVIFQQLTSLVASNVKDFDPELALGLGQEDAVGEEIQSEEGALIPIRSSDFIAGKVSYFDVYVRLGTARFLKILKAGDQFSDDRLTNYKQKGVTHFFIRKEAQPQYLAYCEKLVTALLPKAGERLATVKVSQVMNYGEETYKFLQDQGVSDMNLQYASEFIQATEKLAKQLGPGKSPLLKNFLGDVIAYQHGVAVTMLSSLLIQSLQISSAEPVETVGLASLMHDIGLKILDLNALEHDESKMTDFQRRAYRTHPTVGAEFLQTVRGIKPIVIQAVAQHHERRNKRGFPLQIGAGSISMVGEIIGICNEFFHIIKRIKSGEKVDVVAELQANIFTSFSHPIVAEFRKVFLSKS